MSSLKLSWTQRGKEGGGVIVADGETAAVVTPAGEAFAAHEGKRSALQVVVDTVLFEKGSLFTKFPGDDEIHRDDAGGRAVKREGVVVRAEVVDDQG